MRTTIRHKDLDMTPALSEYIEKKLVSSVARFVAASGGDLPILDIEVGRGTHHHHKGIVFYAAAHLTVGRLVLRAEEYARDVREACDEVRKSLEREWLGEKGRATALARRRGRRVKAETRLDPAAQFARRGRIREEGE